MVCVQCVQCVQLEGSVQTGGSRFFSLYFYFSLSFYQVDLFSYIKAQGFYSIDMVVLLLSFYS